VQDQRNALVLSAGMQFNESLKRELVANYDEIDDDGSFTGTIQRAWMDIKALFGNNDKINVARSYPWG